MGLPGVSQLQEVPLEEPQNGQLAGEEGNLLSGKQGLSHALERHGCLPASPPAPSTLLAPQSPALTERWLLAAVSWPGGVEQDA